MRPNNFNERIGRVKAADVALLVGSGTSLRPVTLEEYLRDFHSHAAYAGSVPAGTSLLSATRDQSVGIRFQAVFLPVASHSSIFGTTGPKAKEFYPDTYNYQTKELGGSTELGASLHFSGHLRAAGWARECAPVFAQLRTGRLAQEVPGGRGDAAWGHHGTN